MEWENKNSAAVIYGFIRADALADTRADISADTRADIR